MDQVKNQMNSVYQAPMQQGGHKTSLLSIIVLLIIAIIVAVLGFGRINALKQEDARASMNTQTQPAVQHAAPSPAVDVSAELDTVLSDDSSASGSSAIDAAFK